MNEKQKISKIFILIAVSCLLFSAIVLPVVQSINVEKIRGFDKGPSYTSVVPIKKATFVNFDDKSIVDDYAYLAAIPTAVFRDSSENKLFSHPLLYYYDTGYDYEEDEKYLTFDSNDGLNYFMEDWDSYCNGKMDEITLINLEKDKVKDWEASSYNVIENDNVFDIASEIALHDWSYSKDAVLAVIDDEFIEENVEVTGKIKETVNIDKDVKSYHFEMPQTNKLNPIPKEFEIPEGYMYTDFRCWYPCISIGLGLPLPGAESLAHITLPAGDKDMQVFCEYEDEWMQVEALSAWNQKKGMDYEKGGSYVYNPGKWMVQVTDIPTKGGDDSDKKIKTYGSFSEILKSFREVIYQVDINAYDGERFTLFEDLPFDCHNVEIEIDVPNKDAQLGFSLIGPAGEEIMSDEGAGKFNISRLGGLLEGESYDIVVYKTDEEKGSYDFTIEYSYTTEENAEYRAKCLTDATEGAVLGSTLNCPLLFTSKESIPESTKEALYKLGVENIHLVDIGHYLNKEAFEDLEKIGDIKEYNTCKESYDKIKEETGSSDIIFSTLKPWTPWLVTELTSTTEVETPGSLHVGPAALAAAHHGAPVLFVENHKELSSSLVWHNEFWRKYSNGHTYPTVAEMYLTGKRVQKFFEEYGFDSPEKETMITVADQYDIGPTWDRVFTGLAKTGRFCGTPPDESCWIQRNIFYPALIFENPALQGPVTLINGSSSERRNFFAWGKSGLKITQPEQENQYEYPVLASLIGHKYRLNYYMEKYYGSKYQCANGIIPGETVSFEPIDDGSMVKVNGEQGEIWPDMSTTEVIPFYLDKGGYSTAFTTSFYPTMDNLNRGVLLWVVNSHGSASQSGNILFWDPQNQATSEEAITGFPGLPLIGAQKEPNPWRGYDWMLGSTAEPDTMTADVNGIIPALLGNPDPKFPFVFRTALDWAPAKKPLLDKLGNLLGNIPIVSRLTPDWLKDTEDYHDGLIISSLFSKFGCSWYKGTTFDRTLENLHSTGFISSSCLIANKYLHLSLVRHGCAYQVMDPWSTSWYSSFWLQTIPRDIILGNTIGDAYANAMSHVGILYISGGGPEKDQPQWWWDIMENVCFYGDPDLRPYVPGTDYSNNNYWEEKDVKPLSYSEDTNINGHMPYGATKYPNEKEPKTLIQEYMLVIIVMLAIIVLLVAMSLISKKKR